MSFFTTSLIQRQLKRISRIPSSSPFLHPFSQIRTYSNQPEQQQQGFGIDSKKSTHFSEWYQQVVIRSGLIDYYDISGCYILRPWAYAIWETIHDHLDKLLKNTGVQNSYFPLLVSEKALTTEKEHIEGFAPEVAWVTRTGNKTISTPLAIRPTSETIMYPAMARWIKSHRDLPLLLNQWNSVVRWEFDHPLPFLRSREFLWQEGHTAWETQQEAEQEVLLRLSQYQSVYENLLCVPVIPGRKTEAEKFAGAQYTTTVEAFIPESERGIQGATSHHLATNFSKIFNIKFIKGDKEEFVWQNSWGFTTRSIGVMIMTHGDDKGLVLPPPIAPKQVIIIPIIIKDNPANVEVESRAREIASALQKIGIRAEVDDRQHVTSGYKYNEWELKGVPLRLEIGPKDIKNSAVTAVLRNTNATTTPRKITVPINTVQNEVPKLLQQIQKELYSIAKRNMDESIIKTTTFEGFKEVIRSGKLSLSPFCGSKACDEHVKQSGFGKSMCVPFEQSSMNGTETCFVCQQKTSLKWTLFGKTY